MEILIKGKCPSCGTALRIVHKDNEENPYQLDDFAFEIIKEASKRAYSVDRFIKGHDSAPLFQDVIDFFSDYKPKKAREVIEKELGNLKERIELANRREELLELAKHVADFDVRVRDDIKEIVKHDKAMLLQMLKKKLGRQGIGKSRKGRGKNDRANVRRMRRKHKSTKDKQKV